MKKIISSLFVLSCTGVALFYFNNNQQVEVKTEGATINLKTSTNVSQVITTKVSKSNMLSDLSPPNVISSFAQLLAGMPPHEQEKYLRLNSQLFGALEFSDHKSYLIFLDQGFPSLKDIDYVAQYTHGEISTIVYNNLDTYPNHAKDTSVSLPAIGAINLLEAIVELEKVIRYYLPNYQQGDPFPVKSEWPNAKRPDQIREALMPISWSYATAKESTAIGYLARARYEQLAFGTEENQSNVLAVLTKLATADKKLGGNSNITNYVKQHYPEHIETYANLCNDL